MKRRCIACGGQRYRRQSLGLVRCRDCGLVVALLIPSDEELTQLYQQEYFFGKEYFDYQADRPALEHNFAKRLKLLAPTLTATTRVVEVGCAYGYFLNLIKDQVGSHKGYDVSVDGVAFAHDELEVNATTDDFLQTTAADDSVDLVCMWDVIEHLPKPERFIAKISELLAPGGQLALTTGDISALVPRWRGDKWRMIHPPTYLYYFAPKTLTKLLAKYGLRVTAVRHPSTYRNLGSMASQINYNRRAQGKAAQPLGWVEAIGRTIGLAKLNIPLNTRDIMEVVAVKL